MVSDCLPTITIDISGEAWGECYIVPEIVRDKMSCFGIVKEDDAILVNTCTGIMVRQTVQLVPCQCRFARGVVIQKVDESDTITIVSVPPMPKSEIGVKPEEY